MPLLDKIKKNPYWLVLLSSGAALFLAYVSELLFNLSPCSLCIYQRIPYFILLLLSGGVILFPRSRKYTIPLVVLLYIVEISLAGYHVGVEHYWIDEVYTCNAKNPAGVLSFKEVAASCSEVPFKFMMLSMAEWNVIYAVCLLYGFLKI
ncbi:MAG: disulfide bond formation protein B [Rickettsiales bacterium]|jgi:disulfide bond formation protein DsbB|nr:disulfide bond formation protein B [Rickettsiales bacterium]